jgi:hypothetical protein
MGGKLEYLMHFFSPLFFCVMVYNYPRLLLFIHSLSYGNPLLTLFQITSVPLSFKRTVAVEGDSTSVDKVVIVVNLGFYIVGRYFEESRRTEETKEWRRSLVIFFAI